MSKLIGDKPLTNSERCKRWVDGHKDQVRKIQRDYYKNRPGLKRSFHLKYNYGMTVAEYDIMFLEQGGLCAICGKASKERLHVDHDHSSGKVRGLLCRPCNRGIGLLGDSSSRLRSAALYLERK
jgi:hypothetical protein